MAKPNRPFLYKTFTDSEAIETKNAASRKAGGQQSNVATEEKITPKINIDMREFQSELPCLLHKRSIEVLSVTIKVSKRIILATFIHFSKLPFVSPEPQTADKIKWHL